MESKHFGVDEVSVLFASQIPPFKVEVERRWCDRFVVGVVEIGQVGMGEGRFHGDAFGWVEGEHFVQQVDGGW